MWLLALLACVGPAPTELQLPPCGDAFRTDTVPELHLSLSDDTLAALEDDFHNWESRPRTREGVKPYHPVDSLNYQCQVVTDAMIRLKGNPCCSWDGQKMQFTISFNQLDEGGRFQGYRRLSLDAPYYDPSLLRERAAYSAFEDMGQPASRVNHVALHINGELYGVYANVEVFDREWLQDRMSRDDAEGTVWKLDYLEARMRARTNSATADIRDLNALLDATTVEEVAAVMDIQTTLQSVAAETLVNQSDGYWPGGVNFVLYDHPRLGFQMYPWDLDNAWDRWPPGVDPTRRSGRFRPARTLDTLLEDPAHRQFYIDTIARRHARLDPDVLVERIHGWAEQIRPWVEADPNRPFTLDEHDDAVDALIQGVERRHAWLATWLDANASPQLR